MPNLHNTRQNTTLIICLLILLQSACKPQHALTNSIKSNTEDGIPDYTRLNYWAAHPDKKDPSDSMPKPFANQPHEENADVFFLHPTTFTDKNAESSNADINDSDINRKTDYSTILYQASIFNASCKIYAPRYRQANLSMYFTSDTIQSREAFNLAYSDIKTAFNYYMEHFNNGRPIIIAAHSQGTTHAKRLLKEYFESQSLMNQLVCAYLIGIPVEKKLYSTINGCKDSTSTGCVVSWRTVRSGYSEKNYSTEDTSLIIVNPITWNSEVSTIPQKDHRGAILYDFNRIVEHPHKTSLKGNALFISKPKFKGGVFYFKKNYHIGDYNLFYVNIREDVARRIKYFQKNNYTLNH